jgi:hypothetical protein
VTSLIGAEDRSDRQEQPVRPVEPVVEQTAEVRTSASRDEVPTVPAALVNEELVDYEASPAHSNMEINVVCFSEDYYVVLEEEEAALLDFGPREAVFQKPKESNNHLNALYMRDHINERPISRMLVDGGAIVNLMPYSLYKKFGGTDEERIKTNMTVSGVSGGDPIGAKGVASMELTVGSKTLATTFFVSEVQGNFSLILGREWIHANQCVPSTLHQFLIQWIGNEIEVVHGDTSSYIATADSNTLGVHDDIKCLLGLDLSDFELISCTKDGFVPKADGESATLLQIK